LNKYQYQKGDYVYYVYLGEKYISRILDFVDEERIKIETCLDVERDLYTLQEMECYLNEIKPIKI